MRLFADHYDLSEGSTVEALIQCQIAASDRQVAEWPQLSTTEPPLASHIFAFGCDVQPAAAGRKIMQDNARHKWGHPNDKVWISHGGLHTVMKTLNAHGDLFYDHLLDVYEAIRDTLEKRLIVLGAC